MECCERSRVDGGELNTWNVYIVLFLLISGIVIAFTNLIGGGLGDETGENSSRRSNNDRHVRNCHLY
ncbi:hypothetical protein F9802_03690 [Bacillus aerolatus]|uniref:Uncharacterized protein n=1 Tax=Bacillus aerolatus TaxID=2653354 RepID=A0A6I1FLG3_9BACI|nr:hypothetical protein [Bacillus aerolatus]KAB7707823.1 hypothetical protein F9802_03690 [Bacillus aerolatus]